MARNKPTKAEKQAADQYEPEREGDVIGLSDANPEAKLPHTGRPDNRRPRGIEPLDPSLGTGIGDTPRRAGSTGADLGGFEDGEADRD